MSGRPEHPIKAVIDASLAEVVAKGTAGASDKAVLLAGLGYLAEMFDKGRRPYTRREYIAVGLEKGGPWAVALTLLGYLLQGLVGS